MTSYAESGNYEGTTSNPITGRGAVINDPGSGHGSLNWGSIGNWASGKIAVDDLKRMINRGTGWDPSQTQAGIMGMKPEQVNMTEANKWGQNQEMLAGLLQRQMLGQGPSVAQQQLQMGQDAAARNAMAMAASNPNINPALASRMAMNAGQQGQLDVNQQAAMLRAQEQMAAMGAYGNLANTAYGQRTGVATDQANLNQNLTIEQQRLLEDLAKKDADVKTAEAQGRVEKGKAVLGGVSGMFGGLLGKK